MKKKQKKKGKHAWLLLNPVPAKSREREGQLDILGESRNKYLGIYSLLPLNNKTAGARYFMRIYIYIITLSNLYIFVYLCSMNNESAAVLQMVKSHMMASRR